jgi:YVTN family beta-propeller protein
MRRGLLSNLLAHLPPSRWTRGGPVIALVLCLASAHAAPFAYITNQGSHDVSVIDLATQQVITTVPVGRSPAGVVASSQAGKVFVSNPDSKSISVIDMRSQKVVATLPAGDGPVGIDASHDGKRLYAADWFKDRLLVFDATTNALLSTIAVGKAPAGVAAHGDDANTVFVAERDDDSVAVLDVAGQRVRSRVRVGSHPFALLHDAPRQRLYALNVQSNDVSVIDTRDARNASGSSTLTVIKTVKVGKAPYGAALADGGKLLYVTNQHDDSVSVIDAETLQVVRTLTGFAYPEGIAAHADRVYVVNWMDDNVSVRNARTGGPVSVIATGQNSRGFGAFIGAPAGP